ncbi:MAG: S9 family peptidase [Wenzhouxiangella sp.]
MKFDRFSLAGLALAWVFFVSLSGAVAAKQPLDHELYTVWNRIEASGLSRDGQWVWWRQAPEQANGELLVRATDGGQIFRLAQGGDARFSHDSQYLVLLVQPDVAEARQARLDKASDDEKPKAELVILSLDDGRQQRYQRVRSFALPDEAAGWVAFLQGQGVVEASVEDETLEDDRTEPAAAEEIGKEAAEDNGRADDQKPGTRLVVASLDGETAFSIEQVNFYAWRPDGSALVYTRVSPDGNQDGAFLFDPASGQHRALLQGQGRYGQPVFSDDSQRVAFLARLHDEDRPEHAWSLYLADRDDRAARLLADEQARFLAEGWHVSRHRQPVFSASGTRLFFGTAPAPIDIPDNDDLLDDEVVTVDIWHWQDHELQPMQEVRLNQERERSYLAVAHLDQNRLVQLATEAVPEVDTADAGDARFALGLADRPYRMEISWDFPAWFDVWLIDVDSGRAEQILTRVQDRPRLSPTGRFIGWWDRDQATWMARELSNGRLIDLGQAIDRPLDDHRNDRPFASNAYVPLRWLADDSGVLIHDRHDVWLVDPLGPDQARMISAGLGQQRGWNIRTLDLDSADPGLDPEAPLLARVFDERSKASGFYRLYPRGDAPLELVMSDHHYQLLHTAETDESAFQLVFTRENFDEFPNLWTSDHQLTEPVRLSDANPQQADYRWGQVELVEWSGENGFDYQGLLFKPEDFDPEQTYPMIVYFYERDSDGLHRHRPPMAHRSVIIPTFYTSNDYIVFVPDTWYREGYPGDSAMEAIMPMTEQLAAEPWVDAERVGVQGHSWAGYKIAYMVTQTDFFRAAAGGAPVGNMVSAYGGIRWQTGMSRMFQYERTQSRLGKTLWEAPELYLHNSPIFKVDQINTPLLMMHNDKDGAVPWEQGIELFVALRRLGKPAWLVNYNDEPHWPTTFANRRDWQIRLQQFFDHYLKDEPAPRWLSRGIPAIEKGSTLGYETD